MKLCKLLCAKSRKIVHELSKMTDLSIASGDEVAFIEVVSIHKHFHMVFTRRKASKSGTLSSQTTIDAQVGQSNTTLPSGPFPHMNIHHLSFLNFPKPKCLINFVKMTNVAANLVTELHRVSYYPIYRGRPYRSPVGIRERLTT
jgi:hypothetical protein